MESIIAIGETISWLTDQLSYMLSFVTSFLPDSPFRLLDYTPIQPYLAYINYFLPMDYIMSTLAAWGLCITTYYSYHTVLRWSKAIQ